MSHVLRVRWTSVLLGAMFLLASCGSDPASGTGGAGANGTGGTGATGGSPDGCAPCAEDGVELADNGCDDNCNTLVDEAVTCDSTVMLDSDDPVEAARAMEFCVPAATEDDWGVIDLGYALPAGEAPPANSTFSIGHGILTSFGASVPRAGIHLLALSSGTARDVDDPGYASPSGFDKGYNSIQPNGFPADVPACGGVSLEEPYDGIGLEVEVRVPPNASGFAFDYSFFSADFPAFVCSEFSDVFAVFIEPVPAQAASNNLAIDDAGNPISVNTPLLTSCTCDDGPPCSAGGLSYACSSGTTIIENTGFAEGASTGWLTTMAPAQAGSDIRLRFAIWDSGDPSSDSTVLIDNFRWIEHDGGIATVPIEQ
jgi:hypothetical protein